MQYILQAATTYQTSEDTWERTHKTKIIAEETTIKEIFEWVAKNNMDGLTVKILPNSL